MLLAIDFDGTICKKAWPDIGEPVPGAIAAVKALALDGHKLLLWTCRQDKNLMAARLWLNEHGIGHLFLAFNENDPERTSQYNNDSRKLGFDLCIDDAALGCPMHPDGYVDWPGVMMLLRKHVEKGA